ncbi:MAG: DUF6517 family protein [Halorientalis sp.]
MHTRTQTLATIALALATVLAGCGFLLGSNSLVFSSSKATVSDDAVSATGYHETNVSTKNVTKQFSAAGQTRNVTVVNYLAKYERRVELGPFETNKRAAVFAVFASPEVKVADQTLNPIKDYSERDILQQFDSQYSGIDVGKKVDTKTVSALGKNRSVSKFNGTAKLAGQDVDVYIQASKFKHEGDFIAVVAIYPQDAPNEEDKVTTLFGGLSHSGDS